MAQVPIFDQYYIERYVTISPFDPVWFRSGGAYLARCADGRLLACFWKMKGLTADGKYCGKHSFDEGKTWGSEFLIPSMGVLFPYGKRIIMAHIIVVGTESRSYLRYSDDYGFNWSSADELPRKSLWQLLGMNYIRMRDGTHILSASYDYNPPAGDWRSFVWRCPADKDPSLASNWVAGGDVPKGTAPTLDEPTVEEMSNGNLVMLMRADGTGYQYKSESSDKGVSWSTAQRSSLTSANAPAYLQRLSFNPNRMVVAWNPTYNKRYPLSIALSLDDCETIGEPSVITNPYHDVSYPAILLLPNGDLIVSWWDSNAPLYTHESAESCIIASPKVVAEALPPVSVFVIVIILVIVISVIVWKREEIIKLVKR